ncbi:uncharacterized protein LOC131612324 [Vicia villosa]|uniref:uncharacterized protein LOC131612324 n=1 Tax=Vicia villosa TaxID=3911 RepID=UPI00273CCE16|nr:uncharacterized protein LOC131612324 [Vicia villosa]
MATKLKYLSSIAKDVVTRCAQKLDITVEKLVEDFERGRTLDAGNYCKNLVEFCSGKVLSDMCCKLEEEINNGSFGRLSFDIMLAWERPSYYDDNECLEVEAKEKEEKKKPVKTTPEQDDISLFYSDIMPLLVTNEPSVGEDAFVWLGSLVPLAADVTNGRFTFESLTAPTGFQLHFPAYDMFLKEMAKCIRHLQKQAMPTGVELAEDEYILHVEGTASSQRVIRHIGSTSWPGRLTLTNYSLYFETSGVIKYEDALKIDLSKDIEQSVEPSATGPWGAQLFDKGIVIESSELSEGVVLEFPELTSSTRRDHWLALIREIMFLHQFLSKYQIKCRIQTWEMHARTILGIIRLHAAREMLRISPPVPTKFLIFSLYNEIPKGDYVLEELPDVLRKVKTGQPCSANSLLRSMNIAGPVVSDSIVEEVSQADKSVDALDDSPPLESASTQSREEEKKVLAAKATTKELKEEGVAKGTTKELKERSTDNLLVLTPSLECAIKQSREEEKKVLVAKATTEELKEEGVTDSVLVLTELLKPLKNVVPWLQEIFTWERPVNTLAVLAASLIITYMEWVGKGAAAFLVWVIVKMLEAREKKLNEQCNEIVINRSNMASDQSTMDSIVSAQHGLYTVHEMMQIANIAMLKIWSIFISKADKHARTVMVALGGLAFLLAVIPFKFFLMGLIVQSFTMAFKTSNSSGTGNRRLKEWWDSIPIVPIRVVDNDDKSPHVK